MSVNSEPSDLAKRLRIALLDQANIADAAERAERLSDGVNTALNAAGINAADSLLARVLTARAILAVSADWWAHLLTVPIPETWDAALNVLLDLPPEIAPNVYIDPTILDGKD